MWAPGGPGHSLRLELPHGLARAGGCHKAQALGEGEMGLWKEEGRCETEEKKTQNRIEKIQEGGGGREERTSKTAWHKGAKCKRPGITGNSQCRQIYRDGKQVSGCWGRQVKGSRVSLGVVKMFSNRWWRWLHSSECTKSQ